MNKVFESALGFLVHLEQKCATSGSNLRAYLQDVIDHFSNEIDAKILSEELASLTDEDLNAYKRSISERIPRLPNTEQGGSSIGSGQSEQGTNTGG